MIRGYNKLTDKLKLEITKLVEKCNKEDGSNRSLYLENDINLDPYMKCFFLYFVDEYVVGILTVLQLEEDKVEVRGFTIPEERNKGYFLELIEYAEDEMLMYDITKYDFVVEPSSLKGISLVEKVGANYQRSSYLLELEMKDKEFNLSNMEQIKFVSLSEHNMNDVIRIGESIFPEDEGYVAELLNDVLTEDTQEGYVVLQDDKIIGLGNISYNATSASIFSIGILASERGQGYGKALLHYLLNSIQEKQIERVILEVGSERESAYHMYIKEGFTIKDQNDYYESKIQLLDDYGTFLEE